MRVIIFVTFSDDCFCDYGKCLKEKIITSNKFVEYIENIKTKEWSKDKLSFNTKVKETSQLSFFFYCFIEEKRLNFYFSNSKIVKSYKKIIFYSEEIENDDSLNNREKIIIEPLNNFLSESLKSKTF